MQDFIYRAKKSLLPSGTRLGAPWAQEKAGNTLYLRLVMI